MKLYIYIIKKKKLKYEKSQVFQGKMFQKGVSVEEILKCLEKTSCKLVRNNQKHFSFPRATPANSCRLILYSRQLMSDFWV